jgi:hypothetical protein
MVLPDANHRTSKFGAEVHHNQPPAVFSTHVGGCQSFTLTKIHPDVCADPYAAAFIRERLGDDKWNIFSARLFERRLGVLKPDSKDKTKQLSDVDSKNGGGAGAIDFMVKVEVVKEVLRTYVPYGSLHYCF